MSEPVRLQPLVRARLTGLGAAGEAWAAALPEVLSDLERRWSLSLGRGLPGGSASYVARASAADGRPLVVKLALPGQGSALAREARVLAAADGGPYARLHAHDEVRGAVLLEALGASLERTMTAPERTLDVLAELLGRAWEVRIDEPDPEPTRSRALVLARIVTDLDARHPGVCATTVRDHALGLARDLAASDDPATWVLCHGDPHPANALRREDDPVGWALVDPDGVRADPAYDLGVVVREWTQRVLRAEDPRTLVASYAARLASRTGLDADRIEAWGFLERVSTGLHVLDLGAGAMGRRFLDSAALLLGGR